QLEVDVVAGKSPTAVVDRWRLNRTEVAAVRRSQVIRRRKILRRFGGQFDTDWTGARHPDSSAVRTQIDLDVEEAAHQGGIAHRSAQGSAPQRLARGTFAKAKSGRQVSAAKVQRNHFCVEELAGPIIREGDHDHRYIAR